MNSEYFDEHNLFLVEEVRRLLQDSPFLLLIPADTSGTFFLASGVAPDMAHEILIDAAERFSPNKVKVETSPE